MRYRRTSDRAGNETASAAWGAIVERPYNRNPPIKGTIGFFISPDGVLLRVEGGSHISTVIRNPSKFGVTTEQIERVYDFFGEEPGVEGVARKQILFHVVESGWIRLRRYPNKYWSVNVPGLTPDVADVLQDWAAKFLLGFAGFREPDPHMPVVITGCFEKLYRFSVKDISEGVLLRRSHSMGEEHQSTECNINGKQFFLWTNPDKSDLEQTPELVRFTVDGTSRTVYLWDYTCAMHTDMSLYLGLNDPYSSANFLKGASRRGPEGKYRMVESHFLQAFKRSHLTPEERNVLTNLLEQDWSWVDQHVEVTGWLERYRKGIR